MNSEGTSLGVQSEFGGLDTIIVSCASPAQGSDQAEKTGETGET